MYYSLSVTIYPGDLLKIFPGFNCDWFIDRVSLPSLVIVTSSCTRCMNKTKLYNISVPLYSQYRLAVVVYGKLGMNFQMYCNFNERYCNLGVSGNLIKSIWIRLRIRRKLWSFKFQTSISIFVYINYSKFEKNVCKIDDKFFFFPLIYYY